MGELRNKDGGANLNYPDHEDPPEVDISTPEHHYYPKPTTRQSSQHQAPPAPTMQDIFGTSGGPSEADMQALMAQHPLFQGMGGAGFPGVPNLGGNTGRSQGDTLGTQGEAGEDPMLQLFKTLGMEGGGGFPGMAPPEAFPAESPGVAALWQLVHLVSMIFIAFFSLRSFDWNGRLEDRLKVFGSEKTDLFYLFGATELGLQGARYIMEKGKLQGSGMLKMLAGILPQPWGGYVGTVARYNVIWATVMRDALILVFVLGVMGFLRLH